VNETNDCCEQALDEPWIAFTEQVAPIHKHITLFLIPSISGTKKSQ